MAARARRSRSASRGIRCPTEPATPMRVALVDLRYDAGARPLPGQARGRAAIGRERRRSRPRAGSTSWSRSRCRPGRSHAARRSADADVVRVPAARRRRCRRRPAPSPRIWSGGRRCGRSPPAGRACRRGRGALAGAAWRGREHGVQPRRPADRDRGGGAGQRPAGPDDPGPQRRQRRGPPQAVVVGPRRVEVLGVGRDRHGTVALADRAGAAAVARRLLDRRAAERHRPAARLCRRSRTRSRSGATGRSPCRCPTRAAAECRRQLAVAVRCQGLLPRPARAAGRRHPHRRRSACRTTPAGPTRPRARGRPTTIWASRISSGCRTSR